MSSFGFFCFWKFANITELDLVHHVSKTHWTTRRRQPSLLTTSRCATSQIMPMLFKSCSVVSIQFFRGLPCRSYIPVYSAGLLALPILVVFVAATVTCHIFTAQITKFLGHLDCSISYLDFRVINPIIWDHYLTLVNIHIIICNPNFPHTSIFCSCGHLHSFMGRIKQNDVICIIKVTDYCRRPLVIISWDKLASTKMATDCGCG